ncbi:hypothetical protein [Kribbella sp. NBC_00359]|uniref:hypothetical protein n=1 Tax=Kribbella sp. NBC_00359 TaxID=2975966 RepID=UPI002E1BA6BC
MNMRLIDGVAVVVEGSQRMRWRGSGTSWTLDSVWPDAADQCRLRSHWACKGLTLVVINDSAPVMALKTEVPSRRAVVVVAEDEEYLELQAPFFDWLPAHQRRRGLLFADAARTKVAGTPTALLPPFLVDQGFESDNMQFAYWTRTDRVLTDPLMRSLVRAMRSGREPVPE